MRLSYSAQWKSSGTGNQEVGHRRPPGRLLPPCLPAMGGSEGEDGRGRPGERERRAVVRRRERGVRTVRTTRTERGRASLSSAMSNATASVDHGLRDRLPPAVVRASAERLGSRTAAAAPEETSAELVLRLTYSPSGRLSYTPLPRVLSREEPELPDSSLEGSSCEAAPLTLHPGPPVVYVRVLARRSGPGRDRAVMLASRLARTR